MNNNNNNELLLASAPATHASSPNSVPLHLRTVDINVRKAIHAITPEVLFQAFSSIGVVERALISDAYQLPKPASQQQQNVFLGSATAIGGTFNISSSVSAGMSQSVTAPSTHAQFIASDTSSKNVSDFLGNNVDKNASQTGEDPSGSSNDNMTIIDDTPLAGGFPSGNITPAEGPFVDCTVIFSDVKAAHSVIARLQDRAIYPGACYLDLKHATSESAAIAYRDGRDPEIGMIQQTSGSQYQQQNNNNNRRQQNQQQQQVVRNNNNNNQQQQNVQRQHHHQIHQCQQQQKHQINTSGGVISLSRETLRAAEAASALQHQHQQFFVGNPYQQQQQQHVQVHHHHHHHHQFHPFNNNNIPQSSGGGFIVPPVNHHHHLVHQQQQQFLPAGNAPIQFFGNPANLSVVTGGGGGGNGSGQNSAESSGAAAMGSGGATALPRFITPNQSGGGTAISGSGGVAVAPSSFHSSMFVQAVSPGNSASNNNSNNMAPPSFQTVQLMPLSSQQQLQAQAFATQQAQQMMMTSNSGGSGSAATIQLIPTGATFAPGNVQYIGDVNQLAQFQQQHQPQFQILSQQQQQQQAQSLQMAQQQQPPVIMIGNVPEHVPLIKLYLLLEVYGVCFALRRQAKQKGNVISRFETLSDAMLCVKHLNGSPFYGSELMVRHFAGYQDRMANDQLLPSPSSDPNSVECTSFDFTHYRHRGRPHGHGGVTGKKFNPTPYLFVANLTEDINEKDIRECFSSRGFAVVEFARKRLEFGIVAVKDTETAVKALIELHSTILKDRYLRITFSGFAPNSVPPGVAAKQFQDEQEQQQRLIEEKLKQKGAFHSSY